MTTTSTEVIPLDVKHNDVARLAGDAASTGPTIDSATLIVTATKPLTPPPVPRVIHLSDGKTEHDPLPTVPPALSGDVLARKVESSVTTTLPGPDRITTSTLVIKEISQLAPEAAPEVPRVIHLRELEPAMVTTEEDRTHSPVTTSATAHADIGLERADVKAEIKLTGRGPEEVIPASAAPEAH